MAAVDKFNPTDTDEQLPPPEEDTEEDVAEEEELPQPLINELQELVKKFSNEEMSNRRPELISAREQRSFWLGNQYNLYDSNNSTWMVPPEGGLPFPTSGYDDTQGRFMYVTNFYTPLGKALISSLCGQTPNVRFQPCDPFSIDDINASKEAEKYRQAFYYSVDIGEVLLDIGRYAYTDGRVGIWVRQIKDRKYGVDKEGNPKTQEVPEVGGVLEWKVPIAARDQSEFHYVSYSKEFSLAQMKSDYPKVANKIKPGEAGPASDQFDRTCRLCALQGSNGGGDAFAHMVTLQRTWIREWAFTLVKDENNRKELMKRFPNGVRITFAGNVFCDALPESMDSCLDFYLPQPGDGQAVASLGKFCVDLQKRVNNLSNVAQEGWEKGSPIKFVDSKAIDTQGMKDQMASPEVYMPIKNPNPSQPISNLFYKEQSPNAPQDMMISIKEMMGPQAQLVTGAQPALFGGAMTNAKTASVYAQAREQALGSLSISYKPLKTCLANICEKAVNLAELRDGESISGIVPNQKKGGYSNINISTDLLRAGYYLCKPEVDEGIPESYSDQKAAFQQFVQFMGDSPQLEALMEQPDNQFFLKQMIGLKGFEIPGADQRNVQLEEIEILQNGRVTEPTPEDIAKLAQDQTLKQAAGQAPPQYKRSDVVQSSVPIDIEFDDHKVHFEEVQRWLYSDEGRQCKQFNPRGYENVRQHGIEHQRAMTQPDAGNPAQANIPNPAVAQQAAAATGAIAAHAQQTAPPQQIPPAQ